MFRMNATFSVLAELGRCMPKAGLRIWLPKPTNSNIAAIVAQLVIKWLLATLTALLLATRTQSLIDSCVFGTDGSSHT